MKIILLCALGVLLILQLCFEYIPVLHQYKGMRLGFGILLAAATVCYGFWKGADVTAWDLPSRLAVLGCVFPVLTLIEKRIAAHKTILHVVTTGAYVILLLLNGFKG